jgi:hypothetical protein
VFFQQKKRTCWTELPGNICAKNEKNCIVYFYLDFNASFRTVGCMNHVKSTIVFFLYSETYRILGTFIRV